MSGRFQFSLRSFLLVVTGLAISLAAIVQVPHFFVFALSSVGAAFASLAAYRTTKNFRPRFSVACAFIAAWTLFYVLSLGPFIALSEIERKVTGHHHIGRLADAYRPVLGHLNNWRSFRRYVSKWIPSDAVGLHSLYPIHIAPDLVGTWRGEFANTVILRPDGTGRGRYDSDDRRLYFEWTVDSSEFMMFQYGSKKSASAWFGREMIVRHGVTSSAWGDKYDVIETAAKQFKLRDKTGVTYLFTRTHDHELESLP